MHRELQIVWAFGFTIISAMLTERRMHGVMTWKMAGLVCSAAYSIIIQQ